MPILREFAHLLAAPLLLACLAAAVGMVLRRLGRRRSGAVFLGAAAAIAYVGSTVAVGDALLGPLERRYPPLAEGDSLPRVSWIVVLGSDYAPRAGVSPVAALDGDGLVRIVEGVRLARRFKDIRMLVSGGARGGAAPPAHGYAALAGALGIDPHTVLVSDQPLDTAAESREVAKKLGNAPFLLVTSAYHMPRAMRLMQSAGARPIPAPTGQLVNPAARIGWRRLLPTSAGLQKTERALHEYLGFLAIALGAA